MRSFILSCCVVLCRSEWPVPFAVSSETIPNVEVSLDAPSNPLPDVSDEISKLEEEREAKQKIHKDKMIRAFNKELASAKLRIAALFDGAEHQLVRQTTSFLKSSVVKVVVSPEKHSPVSVAGIEDSRVADEDSWSEAAVAEMSRLTDIVVATVQSEINAVAKAAHLPGFLQKQTNFLEVGEGMRDHGAVGATEANVRVVGANVPYPTVQSLVGSMETRRDISEDLGKAQALSMYLKLLEFENMLVDAGLQALAMKSKAAK